MLEVSLKMMFVRTKKKKEEDRQNNKEKERKREKEKRRVERRSVLNSKLACTRKSKRAEPFKGMTK